jgi:hypothetical protein
VHLKSVDAREQRALLSARATLARRLKDVENSVLAAAREGQAYRLLMTAPGVGGSPIGRLSMTRVDSARPALSSSVSG